MIQLGKVFIFIAFIVPFCLSLSVAQEYPILTDGKITPGTGFGLGIDDSNRMRNWLAPNIDSLEIKYPGRLVWAVLFITVGGPAVDPPRPYLDFSGLTKLNLEMKGKTGGECVMIGIKDHDDPDDGTEPKKLAFLTDKWKTYEYELSYFADRPPNRSSLNLEKLYVLTELVFPCGPDKNGAQTIYVRSIKFLP